MGVDLLDEKTPVAWVVACLCAEAGVCLDPDPLPYEDPVCLEKATWDRDNGLRVQCGHTGKWYRLRLVPEELEVQGDEHGRSDDTAK